MTDPASLPHVDEHVAVVAAPADEVWRALLATLDSTLTGRAAAAYARAVGCAHPQAGGPRPLAAGSTVVGFRVLRASPGSELVLVGRHRYSNYALRFVLEPTGERTRLRAETRAAFPGLAGRLYRTAVLRSGAHVVGVRRLLGGVRRRAEHDR